MARTSALAALALVSLLAGTAAAQVIALTHVTVIDGTGAPPRNDVTIVMENGRIRDMGPAAATPIPSGAAVTDLRGVFAVPGIINAHGHVGANPVPQLRQYGGGFLARPAAEIPLRDERP
jgi:imidazolonepropionase-like amidohydrolase